MNLPTLKPSSVVLIVMILNLFVSPFNAIAADKVTKVDDRPNWLKGMSMKICTSFYDGAEVVATVDDIIKRNIEIEDGITDPTPDQVANFWNRYVEDMTCEVDGEEVQRYKDSHYQRYKDSHY